MTLYFLLEISSFWCRFWAGKIQKGCNRFFFLLNFVYRQNLAKRKVVMKNVTMGRFGGFTLIELLVVVLIIGILAAVALPQYNKAVDKSRVSTMISLLRPLAEAKKSYYMATGTHARTFDDLDFSIPSSCSVSEDSYYGQTASCGKTVLLLDPWITHTVAGRMRLSDSSEITLAYPVTADRKKECLACPSGSNAEVVCKNLYPNVTAREFGDKEKCSGFYL